MLTEKQKLERKKYIGGSDAGAICGFNQYRTPLDVYFSKISEEIEEDIENSFVDWGNELEDPIRKKFEKTTGLKISIPHETMFHKKHKFLAANVDGLTSGDNILEIKCVGPFSRGNWQAGQMPAMYLCQCAHYASIYEKEKVYLAAFFGIDMPLTIYEYKRNLNFEQKMIKKLVAFWEENIVKLTPPCPITIGDVLKLSPKGFDETPKVATNEIIDIYDDLKNSRGAKKIIAEREEKAKIQLMEYMGAATSLYNNDGTLLCTWKGNGDKKRRFNVY